AGRRYQATDVVLDLTQREDGSLALRGEAASARIPLDGERSAALTRGVVRIDQAADGSARLVALTEAAEVTLCSGAVLTLSEGAELDLSAAADGSTTLTSRVGRAALSLAEGEHLELAGLTSTVRLDGDDRLLSARLHSGVYTRAGSRLEL